MNLVLYGSVECFLLDGVPTTVEFLALASGSTGRCPAGRPGPDKRGQKVATSFSFIFHAKQDTSGWPI